MHDVSLARWSESFSAAIQRLRARGFAAPVLVIDLDLHDGNGTGAWRYSARFLAWLLSGQVTEPPNDMDIILN